MLPVLYGSPISPFVCKAAVLLEEKHIDFQWLPVRPHDRDPGFSAISPLGKIPAYRDERIALSDSSVICFYLEKTYPTPALYPADTVELAQALWWEEYFDEGLIVPMRTIFFQKWQGPLLRNVPTDERILAEGYDRLPPMLDFVESRLRPNAWMVGDLFSIADISLAAAFVNLRWAEHAIDAHRHPKLTVYIERILSRPSFKKTIAFGNDFIKTILSKK